jgi:hypothetical protein
VAITKNGAGSRCDTPSLLLGHGFEQGALRARRSAVDLVGQQQLGEHWARMEAEAAVVLVVDRHAEDVGG